MIAALPALHLVLELVCAAAAAAPPAPARAVKPSVAVFRLEPKHGVPPGAADLLTDTLLNEVRGSGAFSRVVSPAEIAVLMAPEQQQFLVRCASDECALVDNELAGALGVSHILVGNLGKLGNSYLLNLRLLDVQSSVLLASLSERAKGDTEEALLDLVRPASLKLLKEGGLVREPPKAPAAAESPPSLARRGALWGGAVVAGLGAALALPALALWGTVVGVTAWDVAGGWRPGNRHSITATVALLSNVAFVTAAVLTVVMLTGLGAGGIAMGVSGVMP